ncbi:arsenic resistance N-acetyltransferase ArsN2 [Undibacterium sp. Ji50W]|uniref:arsenic resistance N-acetyltransferase ArsN2 n=1 Tax=Undibacterium sp. Ji50W TaxID=3413041 RepID=UPI003BF1C29F
MNTLTTTGALLREFVRLYVRDQRIKTNCGNGASTVQCHVMTELLREDGLTQQTLVKRLGLDKSWISRASDALAADGTLSKTVNADNRRSVSLRLTAAGRKRASTLDTTLNRHADQLLLDANAAQQSAIMTAMQVLIDALQKDNRPGCGIAPPIRKAPDKTIILPKQLIYRPASRKDWSAIRLLLNSQSLPVEGAYAHLQHFQLAFHNDALIACGGLEIYAQDALLRSIAVQPEAQGQGYGQQLVMQLIDAARNTGIKRLYLLTTNADKYFQQFGFRIIQSSKLPVGLQASSQLQGACPASAIAMQLKLGRVELTKPSKKPGAR